MRPTGNCSSRMLCSVVGVLLSIPLVGSAQTMSPIPPANSSAEAETVRAREYQVEAAFQRGDTAFLQVALGLGVRFTHGNGLAEDRAGVLSTFGRPGTFVSRTLTAIKVEMHGEVALSSGRIEIRNTAGRDYTICYVRLYARRSGVWQLVSHRTVGEGSGWTQTCSPAL